MPKPATGHVRWVNGLAIARIRITSTSRADFTLSMCRTQAEATQRARLLADAAKRMRPADVDIEQARKALEMIAAASQRSLPNALAVAAELVGGELRPAHGPAVPTFQQIGEDWTSGKLAKRFPDQIRTKRSAHTDVSRLTNLAAPGRNPAGTGLRRP